MSNTTIVSNLPEKTSASSTDIFLVEDNSTTQKITKDNLFSGFATESYVDQKVSEVQTGSTVDLSNYYTKSETYTKDEVIYLINGVQVSGSGVTSANLGIVNVKDYGAKGDGATDDSAAIRSAIQYMCSLSIKVQTDLGWKSLMPTLYFPNGRYVVSQKGTLNCVGSALQGYNIKGAGYLNTEILYTYDSASDSDGGYLLVNGDDNWFGFSYIEDLTIRGNGSNNFWQIKSQPGSPQANRFRRVGFFNLGKCVTVSFGTNDYNADLFRFESCKASIINGWVFGVESTKNAQSVVHTFQDCDFEGINGYAIYMRSGGTIEVRGGSWIANQNGRMFHFDEYTGAGIGTSNRNTSIYGTKFEFQYYDSTDSNLDYYPLFYNNSNMVISFYGCNFTQFSYAGNSTKANYGYLGSVGFVYFFNCHIPPVFGIKTDSVLSIGMNNLTQKQLIKFKDCVMHTTLDNIVTQANKNVYQAGAYADVIAEDCLSNINIDTQLNQSFGNRILDSKKKMKIVTRSTNPVTSLPVGGKTITVTMPQGAIITDITIYFRFMSGDTSTSTITVTDNKGNTLATASHVGSDPAKATHQRVFEVAETQLDGTNPVYTITITGTGTNSNGGVGGFVAIEYY